MAATLIQAVLAFLLTGVIGGWIAHMWQTRAARENRFFEASKGIYQQMIDAANELATSVGRRLYLSQRICLLKHGSDDFEQAVQSYKLCVIDWNEKLLVQELSVRTKFKTAYLSEFEYLQADLAGIGRRISGIIAGDPAFSTNETLNVIKEVRYRFFEFTQTMMREAQLLHRQMHFGVRISYDRWGIDKMSTQNLIKLLFTSRVEGESVVRSPTDFGLPVAVSDARFGIYE